MWVWVWASGADYSERDFVSDNSSPLACIFVIDEIVNIRDTMFCVLLTVNAVQVFRVLLVPREGLKVKSSL